METESTEQSTEQLPQVGDLLEIKIDGENVPNAIKKSYEFFKIIIDLLEARDSAFIGEVVDCNPDHTMVVLKLRYRQDSSKTWTYFEGDDINVHTIPNDKLWMVFNHKTWLREKRNHRIEDILTDQ